MRVYAARQVNRSLQRGAIAINGDRNGLVRVVPHEVVKLLIVRIRGVVERGNNVAGFQTGLIGC